jgi:hypothetical protein
MVWGIFSSKVPSSNGYSPSRLARISTEPYSPAHHDQKCMKMRVLSAAVHESPTDFHLTPFSINPADRDQFLSNAIMITIAGVKILHRKQRFVRREHDPCLWNDRDQKFLIDPTDRDQFFSIDPTDRDQKFLNAI